jgi:hypothetical protein
LIFKWENIGLPYSQEKLNQISRQKPLFVTHFKTYNPLSMLNTISAREKKVTQRSKHKQN